MCVCMCLRVRHLRRIRPPHDGGGETDSRVVVAARGCGGRRCCRPIASSSVVLRLRRTGGREGGGVGWEGRRVPSRTSGPDPNPNPDPPRSPSPVNARGGAARGRRGKRARARRGGAAVSVRGRAAASVRGGGCEGAAAATTRARPRQSSPSAATKRCAGAVVRSPFTKVDGRDRAAPRTADEAVRVCVRRTAQRASVVSVRGAEGIDPDEGTQRTANPPCRPPHPQPQGTRARRRQQIPKTAQDPPTSEAGTHGGATAVARAHRRRRWGETVTTATTATVTATTATMKTTTTTTATTAPDDAP